MLELGNVALQHPTCLWNLLNLGANNFGFLSILLQNLHWTFATKPSSPTIVSAHGK